MTLVRERCGRQGMRNGMTLNHPTGGFLQDKSLLVAPARSGKSLRRSTPLTLLQGPRHPDPWIRQSKTGAITTDLANSPDSLKLDMSGSMIHCVSQLRC